MNFQMDDSVDWLRKTLFFVLVPLIVMGILFIGVSTLVETSHTKTLTDKLKGVHLIISGFAILAAGIFALFRLEVFRTFDPHLTISHEVTHRQIGDSYIHIAVSATLQNSSKVKVDIREGFFLWQRIQPVTDEEVEDHYNRVFVLRESDELGWLTGDSLELSWQKNELIIEPGETHQEVGEFILTSDIETVSVYTYFYNPKFSSNSGSAQGWGATTFYDIG